MAIRTPLGTIGKGRRGISPLGWALRGSTTTLTVPIAEFTSNSVGSVVVWNHDVAGKLFDALASDSPVPTAALDGQS